MNVYYEYRLQVTKRIIQLILAMIHVPFFSTQKITCQKEFQTSLFIKVRNTEIKIHVHFQKKFFFAYINIFQK